MLFSQQISVRGFPGQMVCLPVHAGDAFDRVNREIKCYSIPLNSSFSLSPLPACSSYCRIKEDGRCYWQLPAFSTCSSSQSTFSSWHSPLSLIISRAYGSKDNKINESGSSSLYSARSATLAIWPPPTS